MPDALEEISLLDSLDGEWIKLPLTVMRDVGPAAQTLGAILRITSSETYVPVADIAKRARLPVSTVRKHVTILHDAGWINKKGREQTRRGWLRRTCTTGLTKQTKDKLEPYGILPWWACCSIAKVGRFPWCARAVLSVVMARLASHKKAAEDQGQDISDVIENWFGDERFRFSLKWLTEQTGLTHDSVTTAKRLLNHRFHVLCWQGTKTGTIIESDLLAPNLDFRVIVTPASEGRCNLAFRGYAKNG